MCNLRTITFWIKMLKNKSSPIYIMTIHKVYTIIGPCWARSMNLLLDLVINNIILNIDKQKPQTCEVVANVKFCDVRPDGLTDGRAGGWSKRSLCSAYFLILKRLHALRCFRHVANYWR